MSAAGFDPYGWGYAVGSDVRAGLRPSLGEVWHDGYGRPMEPWQTSDKAFPRGYRDGLAGRTAEVTV